MSAPPFFERIRRGGLSDTPEKGFGGCCRHAFFPLPSDHWSRIEIHGPIR